MKKITLILSLLCIVIANAKDLPAVPLPTAPAITGSKMIGFTSAPANPTCSGTSTEADTGVFSLGYNYSFITNPDGSIKITFELLDKDKPAVSQDAYLEGANNEERHMTWDGDLSQGIYKYTITIPNAEVVGGKITYACKFQYLNGMVITISYTYTQGADCSTDTLSFSPQPLSTSVCTVSPGKAIFTATGLNSTGTVVFYQWQKEGVNIPGASGSTYTTYTINSPVAADAGNYTVKITGSHGGTLVSNVATLTFDPVSVKGTVSGVQTQCPGTPMSLTVTGYTGSVTKWQSCTNSTFLSPAPVDVQNSATPTLTSPAASANLYYRVYVKSGACVAVPSTPGVLVTTTSTWSGTSPAKWDINPTGATALVFNVNYNPPSPVDLSGCSCQVNANANVTIGNATTPATMTLTNEVNVVSGSLTFNNNSSLVQVTNTIANSGAITYRRQRTTASITDYTYWSTPVANQVLSTVFSSSSPSKFYTFDSTLATDGDWSPESISNKMAVGKGYIIGGTPTSWTASFNGTPNNGRYAVTGIIPKKLYLIGNPYPSALDADTFILNNRNVIDGTLYFWTHNTVLSLATSIPNPGTGVYAYTSDDYASYNLTGGVGTGKGEDALSANGTNSNPPTGKIGAAQGFFTTSNATITGTNEIVFDNYMRVGVGGITGNNSQFFKQQAVQPNSIEKNRLWLDFYNEQGAFKQTLVGYVTGATNEYDSMYDGETFDGNTYVDFYSINQDKDLTIQGRALPFDESDTVPLGYRSAINGDFTIAINQTDGFLTRQNVYLEDKRLNIIHDLRISPYEFTTEEGTFNDRFVLRYTSESLANSSFNDENNNVTIATHNNQMTIKSSIEKMTTVVIYDVLGREIANKRNVSDTEIVFNKITAVNQGLIVKITLENGQILTKKIML